MSDRRLMYLQLYSEVKRNVNEYFTLDIDPDTTGYVNQHGLSRKVSCSSEREGASYRRDHVAYLRFGQEKLGAPAA